jgi:hypothetical protein
MDGWMDEWMNGWIFLCPYAGLHVACSGESVQAYVQELQSMQMSREKASDVRIKELHALV